MKILSIRIKNLASLSGEHFIDFESEPLASAGLVAIVGKTGAGKSTILDAMCLALFNQIPRLKQTDGKLQDIDGSDLLANSPLTVLRRGTAHGFAELCFIAQDQKQYLARWEIKRSREKANGKLQNVQRYLKCLTDSVVIADKTKAVDETIVKITQLNFEQFTRTVLLAQSEVTAFLKARDNERGKLLEHLTQSNIFTKIGEIAFRKTADVAKKRKHLEESLGHIEILSEEDALKLTQDFKLTEIEYQKLESEKIAFMQQQQWFQRKQKIDDEIIVKQQQLTQQEKVQQDLIPLKKHLHRLEEFSTIRSIVLQQQQQIKVQQQLEPQLLQLQTTFDVLNKQFITEQTHYSEAEKALHDVQQFEQQQTEPLKTLRYCIQERDFIGEEYKNHKIISNQLEQQQQPLLNQVYENEKCSQTLIQQQVILNQKLQDSQVFAPLDKGLIAHIQQLENFVQQYSKIENQLFTQYQSNHLEHVEIKLIEQKNKLAEITQQFGRFDQIELKLIEQRQARELKNTHLNKIELIQHELKQYFSLQQECHALTEKQKTSSHHFQQAEKNIQQYADDLEKAKNHRITLHDILQQQRLLHSENIESLRAALIKDEPCNVCGSRDHPYKNDSTAISKTLFALQQQQLSDAENQEQALLQKWHISQNESTKLSAELQHIQVHLQQLNEKMQRDQNTLLEKLNSFDIQLNLNDQHADHESAIAQVTLNLKNEVWDLDNQIQNFQEIIKTQQQLQQQIIQIEHQFLTAEQLQYQVQTIVNCLSQSEQQDWHQHSSKTAEIVSKRLTHRLKQLEQLEALNIQLVDQQQHMNTLKSKQENLVQQIFDLQKNIEQILAKGQKNTDTATQLIFTMTGLSDIKPNDWLIEYDLKRQQKQTDYQNIKTTYEQIRSKFEQSKNQLLQLQTQSQQNIQATTDSTEQIDAWLSQHTDFTVHELQQFAQIPLSEQQQLRIQITEVNRVLDQTASALKTIQEQLSDHLLHAPQINQQQLSSFIESNISNLKNQLEIRDQLKLKIEMHQQNLLKQTQFSTQILQIQQEEHRWGKISGLIGDSKGHHFRDFALQYNLDILIEYANQQLSMLSQRYTLKRLENSLSLAIIDHDMDGETRSVASLSGGESFLTALALSLAIANMAAGSMQIESLFIDEGFGTLDANSLHMVMNALDQLQNQGRKVVLISHIQEMHERIPVQIQVRPLGAGASRIEVVC